ncbi:MAG: pilus assembly protein [Phyllobacteriaceae bacterium]|nr:pilus assembly protein [Phyllobacteriaceae bacterium]
MAIAIVPMLALVGGTVDVYRLQDERSKLQSAADSAVLAAIAKASLSLTTSQASSTADKVFRSQLSTTQLKSLISATPTVDDDTTNRNVTYTFKAAIPTLFLNIVGISTLETDGTSSATVALPVYMDFYLLLDNTPSMGVAATTTDIAKMVANTSDQCAFACHDMSTTPNDYYGLAKKLGVTMRIDVVRSATQQLMDTATATQAVANQFRMAIYTFGSSATATGLTTISNLTSNLSGAKTAAAAIDLMTTPYQNYNSDMDTDFDHVLASVNTAIPTPGSGINASATPQKVLFFVSDGVADANYPTTCSQTPYAGYRCEEPLTVATCTAIKNRGIKIAVLYTSYLPLPTNSWYNSQIAPFAAQIPTNMKACASPGLYFEVTPTDGIPEAMTALFTKAVQTARLTR